MTDTLKSLAANGTIEIDVVEFDQALYEKNLEENNFSANQSHEGKDGKGDE